MRCTSGPLTTHTVAETAHPRAEVSSWAVGSPVNRDDWIFRPTQPGTCGEVGFLLGTDGYYTDRPLGFGLTLRGESPDGPGDDNLYYTDMFALRLAVGEPPQAPPAPFGSVRVQFLSYNVLIGTPVFYYEQGWAATVSSASGRFSVGQEMTPVRRPDCRP
jgi:hypothetical protein